MFHLTEPGLFRDYHVVPIGTILDPGEHYLLSDDDGPTPADATPYDVATDYGLAFGDIVLKDSVGTVIDVLGYGPTSNGQMYESNTLPAYDGGSEDRSYMRRNGGYTFKSYFEVFKRYFLRPKEPVVHPHLEQK